jgi:hypothetical protein
MEIGIMFKDKITGQYRESGMARFMVMDSIVWPRLWQSPLLQAENLIFARRRTPRASKTDSGKMEQVEAYCSGTLHRTYLFRQLGGLPGHLPDLLDCLENRVIFLQRPAEIPFSLVYCF